MMKKILTVLKIAIPYILLSLVYAISTKIVFDGGSDETTYRTVISYIGAGFFYAYLGFKLIKKIVPQPKERDFFHYIGGTLGGFLVGVLYTIFPLHEFVTDYIVKLMNIILYSNKTMTRPLFVCSSSYSFLGVMLTGIIAYECLSTYFEKTKKEK